MCDADCSLREATVRALSTPGSTIVIPPGTYDLTLAGAGEDISDTGDLDVANDTTIVGAGARTTIVRDANGDRVFDLLGTATILISGVTIRDGGGAAPASGGVDFGGGIRSNNGVNLTLTNVALINNAAVADVSGASAGGGGLYAGGATNLSQVTVQGNLADGAGATFDGQGGGIFMNLGGTITNTTVVANTTTQGGSPGQGGGIFVNGATALKHVTVAGNQAQPGGGGQGGGIFVNDLTTIQNSIFAGNLNGTVPDDCQDNGTIFSAGGNIAGTGGCTLTGAGDLPNTDPLLNAVADNGGQVDTMSLKDGSPALDHNADCGGLTTDAAGTTRPQGSACDSGAFERVFVAVQQPAATSPADNTPAPATTVPAPVLARAVNVTPVSGTVLVRLPGQTTFQPLSEERQIPVGSIVDARKGRVRIRVAGRTPGTFFSADFYEGVFQVTQLSSALVSVKLVFGSFKSCGRGAARAAAGKKSKKEVRHLWASGSGPFRTVGHYATATLRGTTWLTADRCDGTLVRVTNGRVAVRDLVKKRNVTLRAGQRYLAAAPVRKKG